MAPSQEDLEKELQELYADLKDAEQQDDVIAVIGLRKEIELGIRSA